MLNLARRSGVLPWRQQLTASSSPLTPPVRHRCAIKKVRCAPRSPAALEADTYLLRRRPPQITNIFSKKILSKRCLREIKLLHHFRGHKNVRSPPPPFVTRTAPELALTLPTQRLVSRRSRACTTLT